MRFVKDSMVGYIVIVDGAEVGSVEQQPIVSSGSRGLVHEKLWRPFTATGAPLDVIGDAGGGYFYTRKAAAAALLRHIERGLA
jgi:hypothetical protein